MIRESRFVQLSRFWHPGVPIDALPPILMVDIYCDESHDSHTYALAGWLSSPGGWDHFAPAWRNMLSEFPVPCFHASEIENRERDKDSRYKDFSRDDAVRFFTRAVDVVCDHKTGCGWLEPVGCSISLSDHPRWTATPDTPWKLLFIGLFLTILNKYKAQNGFSFMFDEKDGVKPYVDRFYLPAKEAINKANFGKIHGAVVGFGNDEDLGLEPLQAADLLAYEWRKRTSKRVRTPQSTDRTSWTRIRSGRPGGLLRHYDAASVDAIVEKVEKGTHHFVEAMMECTAIED